MSEIHELEKKAILGDRNATIQVVSNRRELEAEVKDLRLQLIGKAGADFIKARLREPSPMAQRPSEVGYDSPCLTCGWRNLQGCTNSLKAYCECIGTGFSLHVPRKGPPIPCGPAMFTFKKGPELEAELTLDETVETEITYFGNQVVLRCDGKCDQAWGRNFHGEKGETAPDDPGTYEGGHAKPTDKKHNKWCARECERASMEDA